MTEQRYDIVIVGAGAAGIATAASLKKRQPRLSIALIDPAETHFYQPGWTMVGAGIFKAPVTSRPMASLIPAGTTWIKQAAVNFEPESNLVILKNGLQISYEQLVVAPGLALNWGGVDGLKENLGRNSVTSNYSYETASYTWELAQSLTKGRAIFTQPPMPIKCAGAPQKAMYLSADHWRRAGVLGDIQIDFCTATPALFGVADYVPALMEYVERYGTQLNFQTNLKRIDGENKTAVFSSPDGDIEKPFDMLHVCPPQCAPDFIKASPLSDDAGWVDVDQETLQHKRFENIFSCGDVMNAPNAKTAAAARAQTPVVAENLLAQRAGKTARLGYNGYGSCPLTVERGKIVLAEFGYGGKLLPSFPKSVLNGLRPTRLAWHLKADLLPQIYWHVMLKGREWMIKNDARL
ncbi:MAG: pyridine nucleotide-disulfide oxidoreductase [Halieaceae bacterium]|nr:pyridine nucleotide-disulfide oxidoreductase [Halieaceae bacterium]|tara:strand:- start:2830 stop:4050 length:1221 start_codon:yes stop_codon:yes gene_type:complete